MNFKIDLKSFVRLTIAFVLFTAIGTVSHEYGHILVAKSLGYETTLHYGSMNYTSDLKKNSHRIYVENSEAIDNNTDFVQKAEYEALRKRLRTDNLLVTIGGPLQTILTGTMGLLILLFRRNKRNVAELKLVDWIAVFLSLFWLREVFNVVTAVSREVISPDGSFFGGDERNISNMLNLWDGTVSLSLCAIGLLMSLFIVFKVVPHRLQLTFIASGLTGGILGFILWMNVFGPMVLP